MNTSDQDFEKWFFQCTRRAWLPIRLHAAANGRGEFETFKEEVRAAWRASEDASLGRAIEAALSAGRNVEHVNTIEDLIREIVGGKRDYHETLPEGLGYDPEQP